MLEISHLKFDVPAQGGEALDILRDVSLTVGDGKLVVVTGPNGGGKTSLAKAIMGLNRPTGGAIRWNGTDITALSITERAKLGIRYGFQQPPRFKGMRVKDLIALAAGKESLAPGEGCQYLTQVGLCADDYMDREVDASLSGGEVKRIEIATVLAGRRGLMIFDEPEAGIDLWSFAKLTETFENIHRRGEATLMIISHQERIIQLADEIVVVEAGRITRQGPREEIFPQIMNSTLPGCGFLRGGDR